MKTTQLVPVVTVDNKDRNPRERSTATVRSCIIVYYMTTIVQCSIPGSTKQPRRVIISQCPFITYYSR